MGRYKPRSEAAKRSEGLLKPCPFCGGEARLKKHHRFKDTWYIQCKDCGVRTTNEPEIDNNIPDFTRKSLINQWNRRVENG